MKKTLKTDPKSKVVKKVSHSSDSDAFYALIKDLESTVLNYDIDDCDLREINISINTIINAAGILEVWPVIYLWDNDKYINILEGDFCLGQGIDLSEALSDLRSRIDWANLPKFRIIDGKLFKLQEVK